jgi:hypothetical protein
MVGVTSTDVPATKAEPRRPRFDRPVLAGNLVSGVAWLLVTFPFVPSPALFLTGLLYVAAASAFLAAVYARETLTWRQEALAWVSPWLVAVALWVAVAAFITGGGSASGWVLMLWAGLIIGTECYLAWQIVALAVRRLIAWRSVTAPSTH